MLSYSKSITFAEQNTPKQITVVYSLDAVPFHFKNENDQAAGIIIDLWQTWSKKMGIKVIFKAAPWDETLKIVSSGIGDVHAGLFYTKERDRYLDYGVPLTKTDTHYFTHNAIPQVKSLEELAAYRVGVLEGDYVESFLKKRLPESSIVPFPDYNSIMEALKKGSLKVFAADTPTGLFYLQKQGLVSEFSFVSRSPLYQNDFFFAAREGNQEMIDLVNQGMNLITEDEKHEINRRWMSSDDTNEKPLIIGIDRAYAPLTFLNALGKPSGLFVDFWRSWSEKTGQKIQFRASSWAETIEGLEAEEVDIHSGLSYSDERAKWVGFSNQIYETYSRIYFRNSEVQPETIENYKEFVVGAMLGSHQEARILSTYPGINIRSFGTNGKLINALLKKEIKAIIQEELLMEVDLDRLGLRGEISHRAERLFPSTIHAGVHSKNTKALEMINRGFDEILIEKFAEIEKRWIPNPEQHFYRTETDLDKTISLNEVEKNWIRSNPTIKVAATSNWPPYEFQEDGQYKGFHTDILRLAAKKSGLKIDPVFGKWPELVKKLENKELDLCPGLNTTEERKRYLVFTDPVSEAGQVIITETNENINSIHDLEGKTVAVEKGYANESFLRKRYPKINLLGVGNTIEALKAVITNKADAYIGPQAVSLYLIKKYHFNGLKMAAFFEEALQSQYRIGVIKSKSILRDILQKGLDGITTEEMNAINRKWFALSDAEEQSRLKLSNVNQRWLEAHPVIRLGFNPDMQPLLIQDKDSKLSGIMPELFSQLEAITGLNVTIEVAPWPEIIDRTGKGEIDGLLASVPALAKANGLLASKEHISVFPVVYGKPDVSFQIDSLDDLKGKRVAYMGSVKLFENIISSLGDEAAIFGTDTFLDAVGMVIEGKADVALGMNLDTYILSQSLLTGVKPVYLDISRKVDIVTSIRSDWPEFVDILNQGLTAIGKSNITKISRKWTQLETLTQKIVLTDSERTWLGKNRELKLGVDPSWAPFEFIDKNGKFSGITSGYVEAVAERMQVKIQPVQDLTWSQVIAKAKNGEIDILSAIVRSKDRAAYLNFSKPYISLPIIIAVRKDLPYFSGLDDLQGFRIGVVKDYFAAESLKRDFPELKLSYFPTLKEGLRRVEEGKLDVFVDSLGAITYEITKSNLINIKISAPTEYKYELAFGVRKDWPELITILNKAIDDISDKEKKLIKNTWLAPVEVNFGMDLKRVLIWAVPIAVALSLIIIVILIWNRRLGNEIAEREKMELEIKNLHQTLNIALEASNTGIWQYDLEGNDSGNIFMHDQWFKQIGYSRDDFEEGQDVFDLIIHPNDKASAYKAIDRQRKGQISKYESEFRLKAKDGSWKWILSKGQVVESDGNQLPTRLTGAHLDITERKKAEADLKESHQKITDSIKFASMIQNAFLPEKKILTDFFDDSFIIWEPKDVVGGDIFFIEQIRDIENELLLFVIDCTGHGVPGALVTAVVKAVEQQSVTEINNEKGQVSPAKILAFFNRSLKRLLKQESEESISNAGFDGGVLYYNKKKSILRFAGAETPLFLIQNHEIKIIKGSRHSIGYKKSDANYEFTDHTIEVNKDTYLYLTTDGFLDQNGGNKGFPFGKKQFKELLLKNYQTSLSTQKKTYLEKIKEYQGTEERNDDMTFVGLKIG